MVGSAMGAPVPVEVSVEAFFQEHRRCGDLYAGVEDGCLWMACECGAEMIHTSVLVPLDR